MKSCEQMAADVLRRAEMCVRRQKRNKRIAVNAAVFGSLCLLIAANVVVMVIGSREENPSLEQPPSQTGSQLPEGTGAAEGNPSQTQPSDTVTEGDTSQKPGLILLAYTLEDERTPLMEDLVVPLNYFMHIRDLRGLSEEERAQAIAEERNLLDEKLNQNLGSANMKLGNCTPREDYVITFVRVGCFRLGIQDYSLVEKISIQSASNYGKMSVSLSDFTFPKGQTVTLTPENIPEKDQIHGIVINWDYSDAVLKALDTDPAVPLSGFSDTVIFSVNYTDGTIQKCEVRMIIQDDGQIVACLQSPFSTV